MVKFAIAQVTQSERPKPGTSTTPTAFRRVPTPRDAVLFRIRTSPSPSRARGNRYAVAGYLHAFSEFRAEDIGGADSLGEPGRQELRRSPRTNDGG